jgi:DNA-directed RNA polymerase III subunit RPC3
MMAPKDCRPLLFALFADNFISLQEVPRGADRNPTRTFFLWWDTSRIARVTSTDMPARYVDLRKAYATLLRTAYKTLHNIGVRRQAEAEEPLVKAILEKSQRSDVRQDVERLLTRNEREELAAWEKRSDELTLVETRVEEMAFILRTLGNTVMDDEA